MKREDVILLADNGHAKKTPGKRSPIFSEEMKKKYGIECFREYAYNREIVTGIMLELPKYGVEVFDVVPEEIEDIALTTRANRANYRMNEAKKQGKKCIFCSVHVNAAANSGWHNATGWSVWTTKGKTKSDDFAQCMYEAAKEVLTPLGKKIRTDFSDGDADYEENFTVIYKTKCPAILTENFFQDTKADVEWLLSEEGKKAIIDIHVKGVLKYIDIM